MIKNARLKDKSPETHAIGQHIRNHTHHPRITFLKSYLVAALLKVGQKSQSI